MTANRAIRIAITILVLVGIVLLIQYFRTHKNNETVNPDLSISALNQTQNIDATTTTAHPKDLIVYTVKASNPSEDVISAYVIEVGIGGITNNAVLTDASGANYNSANNSLVWTPLDIPANGSIEKNFTVRVKDALADDKNMTVAYGNELTVTTGAAVAANNRGNIGSNGAYRAPSTGIPGWISFYLAVFLTFGVMLFRIARKMGKPIN